MKRGESQKVHTCSPEASAEPHCEQIIFTGAFCAADALTPVRRSIHRLPFPVNVNHLEIKTGGLRVSRKPAQNSPCWARISRLKAMRRSSATTAKFAQPARSRSAQSFNDGSMRALVACSRLRIL